MPTWYVVYPLFAADVVETTICERTPQPSERARARPMERPSTKPAEETEPERRKRGQRRTMAPPAAANRPRAASMTAARAMMERMLFGGANGRALCAVVEPLASLKTSSWRTAAQPERADRQQTHDEAKRSATCAVRLR